MKNGATLDVVLLGRLVIIHLLPCIANKALMYTFSTTVLWVAP